LVPLEKLNIDNDFSQQWSWDENGKKLLLKTPDQRKKINIKINN
jgi:alpha-glucosidase